MAEYKFRVIDNFLSPYLFNKIIYETNPVVDYKKTDSMKWGYCKTVLDAPESLGDNMYFENLIYSNTIYNEKYYKILKVLTDKLDVKSLIRIKFNLYTRTDNLIHHPNHSDTEFPHKGGLFSLNTCDGFTVIDEEEIPSVANRMILFDPYIPHHSTNCTDSPYRMNVNINYF